MRNSAPTPAACRSLRTPCGPGLRALLVAILGLSLLLTSGLASAAEKQKRKAESEDPYAEYVWPPPPNEPRIKLERIITGRKDVEGGGSKMRRFLIGASPPGPYDLLEKPTGVAIDAQERILVTDWGTGALLRFDFVNDRMDIFGTAGATRLARPMGVDVAPDGTIYVADQEIAKVVGFDPDGNVKRLIGGDELENPVGVAATRDNELLYVVDSKRHAIVVYEIASGKKTLEIGGQRGDRGGLFAFPSSLAFDDEGNLLVVDVLNWRVQLLTREGDFLDSFGGLGTGFGSFVRPKDVAVDQDGLIYVSDTAFNNFQIFDVDFTLLTFVGSGGDGPGEFQGLYGIDVRDGLIAVTEQQGKRIQLFRFLDQTGE